MDHALRHPRHFLSRTALADEIEALAVLLAEVVKLADNRAVFPSQWELIAELAIKHESVCRALAVGAAS